MSSKSRREHSRGVLVQGAGGAGDRSAEIAARIGRAVDPVTEDRIRARAYELSLARNGGPGDAASDWRRAEEECRTPPQPM